MARIQAPPEVAMPAWGSDLFNDYLSFLNDSVENLDVTSPSSTDKESNSQTPSTSIKKRKRGRPRILDGNNADVATKERRKAQIRVAQRAYRSRKEEKTVGLSNKVMELEQKLLIVRGLYLSTHAAVISAGLPLDCGINSKLLHENLQLLLANTELEDPTAASSPATESPPTLPNTELYSLLLNNVPSSQDVSPLLLPDKSYMMFDDSGGFAEYAPSW
ncbi:hypothetical protein BJX99DRAFT_104450 [Aspergillus californicus]